MALLNPDPEEDVSAGRFAAEDFVDAVVEAIALDSEGEPIGRCQIGTGLWNEGKAVRGGLGGRQGDVGTNSQPDNVHGRGCRSINHMNLPAKEVKGAVINTIRSVLGYAKRDGSSA